MSDRSAILIGICVMLVIAILGFRAIRIAGETRALAIQSICEGSAPIFARACSEGDKSACIRYRYLLEEYHCE